MLAAPARRHTFQPEEVEPPGLHQLAAVAFAAWRSCARVGRLARQAGGPHAAPHVFFFFFGETTLVKTGEDSTSVR